MMLASTNCRTTVTPAMSHGDTVKVSTTSSFRPSCYSATCPNTIPQYHTPHLRVSHNDQSPSAVVHRVPNEHVKPHAREGKDKDQGGPRTRGRVPGQAHACSTAMPGGAVEHRERSEGGKRLGSTVMPPSPAGTDAFDAMNTQKPSVYSAL